jgi:N-methylhydantoinase A/oxoprolinase/acetone carboxylase beta subunit
MGFALVLALCASASAVAAPIPFQRGQVSYDLKGEALKDFLTRFFAEQGMQVVFSPLVESQSSTLNGPRAGTPDQVFRSIASANQLSAYFDGSAVDTPVYERSELPAGVEFDGPAVIDQLDTTTLVPPGVRAAVDEWLNIRMEVR